MPKRVHGYNPEGLADSVLGRSLPPGWSKRPPGEPVAEEVAEEVEEEAEAEEAPPKPRRGRPPKNP